MKTNLFLLVLFFSVILSFAHAPDQFNYQAVVRDNTGALVANTSVALRFSIYEASAGGTISYQELQTLMTNQFGLFTCQLSGGSVQIGATWATHIKS